MSRFFAHSFLSFLLISIMSCNTGLGTESITVKPTEPVIVNYKVTGNLTKRLVLEIDNPGAYAGISIFVDDLLFIDDLNIPKNGTQTITSMVKFRDQGEVELRFQSFDQTITINSYYFEDIPELKLPIYKDISKQAGLDKVSSIKYGGPSIADIDNDGDYDFIVNNHNAESSKLYWNNGDGTVSKHDKNLSRWFKHDLHGTALGDYDNDGDLDLVLTQGGGNGKNPSTANFYLNDNNTLVRYTGDVHIDKGGRGRGARWLDMDLDGDLDLLLFNEASLKKEKPQHFFYENIGDGTFDYKSVAGIEDVEESRLLVTDFNNDHIDDIILYSPLTLWKGNGDFTFTDVTSLLPENISSMTHVMAMTDIDIDNDGDLDFYLARGKLFEHGKGETPSLDFNPITKELAIKTRGYKGVDKFEFVAEDTLKLHKYYYLSQGAFLGKEYPIFMGKDKNPKTLAAGDELEFTAEIAKGWPNDISENGFYVGNVGNNNWKAALVRDGDIFWQYRFSLSGVADVTPSFIPQNRNHEDIILRNDDTKFSDVSKEWNAPLGGNALGVTTGDFNNDSHQDLFVYRWGRVGERVSDFMLLNTGNNSFETVTMHGANDVGGPGNGDMGQAFDFDSDGRIDLLNGSEGGEWYLYSNQTKELGNYVTVRVGYAPKSNIDPLSAEVIVKTKNNEYTKRVGSAGEVFSQSLMNIMHFGLGAEEHIKEIQIRWRNGETANFKNKVANAIYDTDQPDPESLNVESLKIRKGTKVPLSISTIPKNANQEVIWSSSDDKKLLIDANGIVSAIGAPKESAIITAISKANGLSTKSFIEIEEWYPKPVASISIQAEKTSLYVGQRSKLITEVVPKYADNSELVWTSATDILTLDEEGYVNAMKPGKGIIKVATKDGKVSSEISLFVKPYIKPYIKIVNKAQFQNKELIVGSDIEVQVEYHAGSEQRVINADEGGVRFWLRHFKSKWIPQKDIILTSKDALKTQSGKASMLLSLEGLTPTKDLPEGHFYQLYVTFTSSDGNRYSDEVLPLELVFKK